MKQAKHPLKIIFYPWAIWFVASLFYGIEFFQRVSPSVMAEPLMQSFHMNEATLGFINSFYFYAYAIAQIPVGLLLDEYGARRLLALSCFVISLGSLLFATSGMLWILAVARILIGFGSAFAFIGVLKLAAIWFSNSRYPLIVGLTNTLGVLGAVAGEAPFAKLVQYVGWQQSMIIVSIIGFGISILLYLVIRDHHKQYLPDNKSGWKHILESLTLIIKSRQTWLTAIYAGLMVAPIIAFAELWAVSFFERAYQLSSIEAANLVTMIFIGIGVGGPVNGFLAGVVKNPKHIMFTGNFIAFVGLLIVIYYLQLNAISLGILLFIFGFATSTMLIAFSINKERFDLSHSATVVAFTNMMIMIMGAIYQPTIGELHDWFMTIATNAENFKAFQSALTILPLTSVVSMLLVKFIKVKTSNT